MLKGTNHWNQGGLLANNEYKLKYRVSARSCGEWEKWADAQLLTWWGDCRVCSCTLKMGPRRCLSVFFSPLLQSFNASLRVCVGVFVGAGVHLCLWTRPIDILRCDPPTPDNSNQEDVWEARRGGAGGGGAQLRGPCVSVRGGEGKGESSARKLLQSSNKSSQEKRRDGSVFF